MNEVNAALENPNVWNDPKRAQELGKEKRTLEQVVETINHLTSNITDNLELFEMSKDDNDIAGIQTIEAESVKLAEKVEELEFRRMFSNPADPLNCFIDIQAGAGGTEACDWAGMLLRQYLKYCERKGFKTDVEEQTDDEIAGIKSATIKVEGEYAFGLLRSESGGRRRSAHQQDRLGGAPDPHPDRHRRAVPGRPQPAQQPRRGLEAPALAPVRP